MRHTPQFFSKPQRKHKKFHQSDPPLRCKALLSKCHDRRCSWHSRCNDRRLVAEENEREANKLPHASTASRISPTDESIDRCDTTESKEQLIN